MDTYSNYNKKKMLLRINWLFMSMCLPCLDKYLLLLYPFVPKYDLISLIPYILYECYPHAFLNPISFTIQF